MHRDTFCRSLIVLFLAGSAAADDPLFERDILPILQRNCLGCHGGLRQKGGLDLRTIPAMQKGGDSGAAVEKGDAGHSELWLKVQSDEMPQGERKLPAAEKEVLKRWILAGLPTISERRPKVDPILTAGERHPVAEVAAAVDRHLDNGLAAERLTAAPLSDDAEFLRRVYLDLTGRTPTSEQAVAYLDSNASDKRARLIDELLAAPQFGEQFGRMWRDWISPPELPSDPNSGKQPHREAQDLARWFAERIQAQDSWDKMVRRLIAAEGDLKSQPQIIFHGLVGEGGKVSPDGSARAVAGLFMGVQLQCAQCHDDPYRTWAQDQHWGLAAFFSRTTGEFNKVAEITENKPGAIVIPKSAFLRAGTSVPAMFLGSDQAAKFDRPLRQEFVDWLTARENPYFAQAFANRMWFYLFSRGLVHPVDDFRDLNPPSHPGLIRLLANEFTAADYDIRHLMRCICNSRAYQRTSRVDAKFDEETARRQLAAFGRMPLRVMSADVLYESLKLAYRDSKLDLRGFDPKAGNANGESAPVGDAYLEFSRRFCTNEEDATDFTHGVPQLLTMLNHPRLLADSKSFVELLRTKSSHRETVEWLYLSTLSRRPTAAEAAEAIAYCERVGDPVQSAVDVLWMLVNRSEFILIR